VMHLQLLKEARNFLTPEILLAAKRLYQELLIPSTGLYEVTVELFLCFSKHHEMKTNGEVVAQPPTLCSIVSDQSCGPPDLNQAPTREVVWWAPYPKWKYWQRGKSLLQLELTQSSRQPCQYKNVLSCLWTLRYYPMLANRVTNWVIHYQSIIPLVASH
jgi:hypothetical protein